VCSSDLCSPLSGVCASPVRRAVKPPIIPLGQVDRHRKMKEAQTK
jgi:hypothetical protein